MKKLLLSNWIGGHCASGLGPDLIDDDDHRRCRHNHRVHAREHDRAQGEQQTTHLSFRQRGNLRDQERNRARSRRCRTRIKVGVPVHIQFTGEGDTMMVNRHTRRRLIRRLFRWPTRLRMRSSGGTDYQRLTNRAGAPDFFYMRSRCYTRTAASLSTTNKAPKSLPTGPA